MLAALDKPRNHDQPKAHRSPASVAVHPSRQAQHQDRERVREPAKHSRRLQRRSRADLTVWQLQSWKTRERIGSERFGVRAGQLITEFTNWVDIRFVSRP